jgi:hypothetical protein
MQEVKPDAADTASPNGFVSAFKERAPRLAMTYALGQASWPLIKKLRDWQMERSSYTITVDGSDEIYGDLHKWVLDQLPSKDRRSLLALSGRVDASDALPAETVKHDAGGKSPVPKVQLRYDGSRTQRVLLGQHKVEISVSSGTETAHNGKSVVLTFPKITLKVSSPQARDAVHEKLNDLLRQRHEVDRKPLLRIGNQWGSWRVHDNLPLRTMESVVLPEDQSDRLIKDVEHFLESEGEYKRRFIPWHRGHLYDGPAGTGKTSVAKAVAHHFGLDLWYIPLGDMRSGSDLLSLTSTIEPRSVLLLEDIDVFHAATQRDDDSEVTLSDLLNCLDGVASAPGVLVIMTTNRPEALDEAMIRPGRVDLRETFHLATTKQIGRLYKWFFESPWPTEEVKLDGGKLLSPADIVGIMHVNANDPMQAAREIMKRRGQR